MLSGVNFARETAACSLALNTNAVVGALGTEWNIRLNVDWVPADLDESLAVVEGVGTSNVGGPVTVRLVLGSPDAAFLGRDSGRIDVVAII